MRDSLVRGEAFEREREEEIETVRTVYYKSGEDKFLKGSLINNSDEISRARIADIIQYKQPMFCLVAIFSFFNGYSVSNNCLYSVNGAEIGLLHISITSPFVNLQTQ